MSGLGGKSAAAAGAIAVMAVVVAGGCFKPDRGSLEQRRAAAARKHQMVAPAETYRTLGAAAGGGAPVLDEEERGRVVARFGARAVTLGDLAARFASLPRNLRLYAYTTPDRVQQLMDNVLDVELMATEARRLGLDRDARVLLPAKAAMVRAFVREELPRRVPVPPVTDEDVRAEFEAHPERYAAPVEARAAQLVTLSRPQAEALRAQIEAEAGDDPARRTALFRTLVARHSVDDATRADGGDLPPVRSDDSPAPDALPRALRDAALALERPGALSPVVDVGTRYHVLLLTERSGGERRPLEAVEGTVRSRLFQERQEAAAARHIAELRAGAAITIDHDGLRRVSEEAAAQRAGTGGATAAPQGDTP